ncbi:hypothetical protein GCM10011362_26520 [Marinobacter halophilus]|nr:hypothetical protein GCM10011362_26520 [Marinobacter halophilus]
MWGSSLGPSKNKSVPVFPILDYQAHFKPIGDVQFAVWFRVRNDKIHTVETFYNAAVVENMLGGNRPRPWCWKARGC